MTVPNTNPKHPNGKLPNGFDGTGDFVENLLERCATEPRYVFTQEVIEKLASLKQEDRLAFENLRVRLKNMGFRLAALDDVIANSHIETEREPSQMDILMGFADDIDLFHTADGTAYADILASNHIETWSIRSEGFAHWISRRFFQETHKALNNETLRSSLAKFKGFRRVDSCVCLLFD